MELKIASDYFLSIISSQPSNVKSHAVILHIINVHLSI